MADHDDFDRALSERLRSHESRVPGATTPDLATIGRGSARERPAWGWGALVAAGGVAAGLLLVLFLGGRLQPPTGHATATPQPTSSASSSVAPSASVAPSQPTLTPSIAPEATLPAREGWTLHQVTEADANTSVFRVAEARGKLFAVGHVSLLQPAIWVSADGVDWVEADVPTPPAGLGFTVFDIVDAGDRLVALAAGGLAAGSGAFATMIYVSDDGLTWREAEATPGVETAALFTIVRLGDRLVALGQEVWVSDDHGLTWVQAADRAEVDGTMFTAAEHHGLLVAAGQAGQSDITELPFLVWTSTDAGETWDRSEVDAGASDVTFGPDGRILMSVRTGTSESESAIWTSFDGANSWSAGGNQPCCITGLTATPTGYVATFRDESFVLESADGETWTEQPIGVGDITCCVEGRWLPSFGLVLAVNGDSVVLGPNPYP